MLEKYLPRAEFVSYEDFLENFQINIPDDFNFGFDIVDEWARRESDKLALMWCDDTAESAGLHSVTLASSQTERLITFKVLG